MAPSRRSTRTGRSRTSTTTNASQQGKGRQEKPVQKWVQIMRAPAPGISFRVKVWRPYESLTAEERREWDPTLQTDQKLDETIDPSRLSMASNENEGMMSPPTKRPRIGEVPSELSSSSLPTTVLEMPVTGISEITEQANTGTIHAGEDPWGFNAPQLEETGIAEYDSFFLQGVPDDSTDPLF